MLFSLCLDSVFGSELSDEVGKSCHTSLEAPWVLIKCVEEIEKWCNEHSECPTHTHMINCTT